MTGRLRRWVRVWLPVELRRPLWALRQKREGRRLRARRAAGDTAGAWQEALPSEAAFWKDYLRTRGASCRAQKEFAFRFDPAAPLQRWAEELLPAGGGPLRILDVGAGPATWLGKRCAGRTLEIVPVDPLADAYHRLMAEEGVAAPAPTIACEAEELRERFGASSFDLVFARNSIDHARDAFRALSQMFALVRPGGALLLVHALEEGRREFYAGLHQWDFVMRGGELFIGDRAREKRVLALSDGAGWAQIYCRLEGGACWAAYRRERPSSPATAGAAAAPPPLNLHEDSYRQS
jgi:SAM-dependent methyltransferase